MLPRIRGKTTMNVKNTITLPDRYIRYAERMVEEGQFPSIEKVVEAGIDELMRADELTPEQHDVVTRMGDEIRRRMTDPAEKFIPWDEESLAEKVKAKLAEKYRNS
jgi:antitoxin ParD1/3/4